MWGCAEGLSKPGEVLKPLSSGAVEQGFLGGSPRAPPNSPAAGWPGFPLKHNLGERSKWASETCSCRSQGWKLPFRERQGGANIRGHSGGTPQLRDSPSFTQNQPANAGGGHEKLLTVVTGASGRLPTVDSLPSLAGSAAAGEHPRHHWGTPCDPPTRQKISTRSPFHCSTEGARGWVGVGVGAQKLGALLTVCVEVLPDLQELGRRELGQVQVRGLLLLLRASHGERLGDVRQLGAVPARAPLLCSPTPSGSCAPRGFIYAPEAARPRGDRQGARAHRESVGGGAVAGSSPGGLGRVDLPGGEPEKPRLSHAKVTVVVPVPYLCSQTFLGTPTT